MRRDSNIALTSLRSPPVSCYSHILCFFQTVDHLCFSFTVQGWNHHLTKEWAWQNMVPDLQYPNQFAKSNIVDHRKWPHVFCSKNSDAPCYFLSFLTWLRPCCSKTALYRCIGLLSPFLSQEFAGVCCYAILNGTLYSKCLTLCMAALFYSVCK